MAAKSLPKSLDSATVSRVEEIKKKLAGAHQTHKKWLQCGSWLRSGVVHYEGPDGRKREWETVERTTRKGPVDATDIFMLIDDKDNGERKVCLVAVYRPPIDKISLEFPSGLMEEGESLECAALRELEEETGHTGTVTATSPELHIDPWKSNESIAICTVVSKAKDAGAGNCLTKDEDEFLEPLELPIKDLLSQLETLQKQYGFAIDARLYYFALGLCQ